MERGEGGPPPPAAASGGRYMIHGPTAVAAPGRRESDRIPSGDRATVGRGRLGSVTGALWQPVVLVLLIVMGTSVFGHSDIYPLLVLAGIYGIAVVGVSLLAGLGGVLSIGHAAFLGIGAYASALATVQWGLPPLVGVVLGVAAALLLGVVTSPILRLSGWYLGVATLALLFIVQRVVENTGSLTGGPDGIYGIPALSIGGLAIQGEKQYFVLAWTIVLVLFVLARNIARSRFGRAMTAIHKDPEAAASLGVPIVRYKATIWLIACVPGAIAGSIFAHYSMFIAPENFSLATSNLLFTAVIVGGERSIFGALAVLTVLVALPSFASGIFTTALVSGAALVVVYLLSPSGTAGLLEAGWRRLRKRGGQHA